MVAVPKQAIRAFLFVAVVTGQCMQNVSLPLALSEGVSMSVVLLYASLMYYIFFSLADIVMDVACHVYAVPQKHRHTQVNDAQLVSVGFMSALNGIGVVFGAAPTRTPLTLQMAIMMVANLLAGRFKIFSYKLGAALPWFGRTEFHKAFWAAWACYILAFGCLLVDKVAIAQVDDGSSLNGFCLFFVVGSLFAMMYNVRQDYVMADVDLSGVRPLASLKQSVSLLRRQLGWMFMFLWLGVLIAMIPGADQNTLTRKSFEESWAKFLPFGNTYMNLFNLGYLITFLGGVFLNKIDSSLTLTASNMSAICAIGFGWAPSIGMTVVGYSPNVPLTIAAIVLALLGLYPSEKYSAVLREHTAEYFADNYHQLKETLVAADDDAQPLNAVA
jgi:hypothetical protein